MKGITYLKESEKCLLIQLHSKNPLKNNQIKKNKISKPRIKSSANEKQLFGENFGARDPTAAEIESNFSEKVLGNFNTEHIIKPPDKIKKIIGLNSKEINLESKDKSEILILDEKAINLLKNQIPGWKLNYQQINKIPKLNCELKLKNKENCEIMWSRIKNIKEIEKEIEKYVNININDNLISFEILPINEEGLTINEFIIASKINEIPIIDLIFEKKQRFWA